MRTTLPALFLLGCGGASDVESLPPEPPPPLETSIELDRLMHHLEQFQAIADANGGTRAAGTPGFDASVDYATGVLEEAGYDVVVETFTFDDWVVNGPSVLEVSSKPALSFESGTDIAAMSFSVGGDITAELTAVDLVLPPTADPSSTSGCEESDFDGFPAGNVALIQRGGCYFVDKARNAEAAGAAAMIVFNEGQQGRTELEAWTLDPDDGVQMPTMSASFATGEALAGALQTAPVVVRFVTDVEFAEVESKNVIVQTGGNANQVLVVGGHLDSVVAGPGINDNGSGSALVLELAVQMANRPAPTNQIRFALWGAEELGLLGSNDYVATRSPDQLDRIIGKLNFDMVGSPNGSPMIYDGDGDDIGNGGPQGSGDIEAALQGWFDKEGRESYVTLFDGRSDYFAFIMRNIPAGGLFSGAEGLKTSREAELFGGASNTPRDPCYHLECDTIDNIDQDLFLELSLAAAHATEALSAKPPSWITARATREMLQARSAVSGCGAHKEARE